MNKQTTKLILFAALLASGGTLRAGQFVLTAGLGPIPLPFLPNDSIDVVLDNGGAVNGLPGTTTGFGATIVWNSANDWLQFNASNVITNSSVFAGYTDTIGSNGGPTDYAVPPDTNWTTAWVSGLTGVGDYQIDPGATPGNVDNGTLQISFTIYSGDPAIVHSQGQIPDSGTTYLFDVGYSVAVDTPQSTSGAPEPATFWLILSGSLLIAPRMKKLLRGAFPD